MYRQRVALTRPCHLGYLLAALARCHSPTPRQLESAGELQIGRPVVEALGAGQIPVQTSVVLLLETAQHAEYLGGGQRSGVQHAAYRPLLDAACARLLRLAFRFLLGADTP